MKVERDEDGAFRSQLCDAGDAAELTQAQQKLWEGVNVWLDQPIGRLSRDIWPDEERDMALHGSPIADFFNTVPLWASGADVSCAALGNEFRGFASSVTVRDMVVRYVYTNTLSVLEATAAVCG